MEATLNLFNTMERNVVPFTPISDNNVRMYTCGPTVYNYAHIGNYRAYMFEDLLRRTFKYFGYDVTQVMNLTDVDDKTIRDSIAENLPLNVFTEKYKKAFFEDLNTLHIEPAEHYPAATDHIPEMIELIQTLMDKGFAYQADDNSVYFSIEKFEAYGKLARIDFENQRSGVRIKNDEYAKDAVADFALWKAWDKADGDVKWESPWGTGRPGWHIECSAMSMKYLGKTFDVHTGGIDNMFPHHEDEIAQSESANGCTYVNYWLHCAHLILNGEKMSKSLGNFYTLRELLDKGFSGREIRWVLLGTHYRKKLNFTFQNCEQAKKLLARFDALILSLKECDGNSKNDIKQSLEKFKLDFKQGLGDDLNISRALASVFGLQKQASNWLKEGLSKEDAQLILDQLADFNTVLGVFDMDIEPVKLDIPEEIIALAEQRKQARADKDFGKSDELRDAIVAKGWLVKDVPAGYELSKQ